MYSDLTLYYLNQLGITPWINKQHFLNNKTVISELNAPKIVILKKSQLNEKAQVLFDKMLGYLNLDDSELLISDTLPPALQIKAKAPKAILLLGLEADESLSHLNCPVLFGNSPEDLLGNPSQKRAVFKALHSIKALVHAD